MLDITNFEKRVLLLAGLNFWDLIASYYFVVKKEVQELNPVMEALIKYDPRFFVVYKIMAMGAIVVLANFSIKNKLGYFAYWIITSFYAAISFLHLVFYFNL